MPTYARISDPTIFVAAIEILAANMNDNADKGLDIDEVLADLKERFEKLQRLPAPTVIGHQFRHKVGSGEWSDWSNVHTGITEKFLLERVDGNSLVARAVFALPDPPADISGVD